MSESNDSLPTVRADLHVAEFDLEYVVWDPTCETVHLLTGLHAIAFDACRHGTTFDSLLAEIADITDADPNDALAALEAAVEHLRVHALFSGLTAQPP
jgi:hypothetical protein